MLSQQDRIGRINAVTKFAVIDNSMESLLRQAEEIASFIRYYNLNGEADGYFDQFLQDLCAIREQGVTHFTPDGNLEPAQALLLTFLKQLHEITTQFNQRWEDYAYWYFQDVLKLKPLPLDSHKVCLLLTKNTNEIITIEKGFGFIPMEGKPDAPAYRLMEDTLVENTAIEQVISIYFNRQRNIFPAARLGFVTTLNVKTLSATGEDVSQDNTLFGEDKTAKNVQPLGFLITSPSLLLREGKRAVTIALKPENLRETDKIFEEPLNNLRSESGQSLELVE